jgi:glycerophosphoryl diester phosphodiesterase
LAAYYFCHLRGIYMKSKLFFAGRPEKPLVIAHRGARAHAPENTLAAATLAHTVQADAWELDVNYTRDGKLVVMHDDSLARTTNITTHPDFAGASSFRVCDFTLEEIRKLDAGSWYAQTDPHGRIAAGEMPPSMVQSFTGMAVPTLEEALTLTKSLSWRVNVEIKNHEHLIGHTTVTKDVLDLVRKMDMVEQVIMSSFQLRYLLEAHTLLPELATGALVEGQRPADAVALCREHYASAYHPDRHLVCPDDLAALRNAGIAVNIWTVNAMAEAETLTAYAATGMITDYPAAVRAMMLAKGFRSA